MPGYGLRMKSMDSHKFLFSHISTAAKKELVEKINALGGFYVDSNNFDKSASHLVCGSLKRTEKFYGACITGKWIISPQFILDSCEVGMWLDEESYVFRVENKDPSKDQLASTARRWRNLVHNVENVPFQDWRVALLMSTEKAAVFKRLLIYGGADIEKLSQPFYKCSKINYVTYVFVDEQHASYVPELQNLGLLCLKEKFLGAYILEDPPPDPFDYIVTDTAPNESLNLSHEQQDKSCKKIEKPVTSKLPSSSKEHSLSKDVKLSAVASCSSSQSSSSVTFTKPKNKGVGKKSAQTSSNDNALNNVERIEISLPADTSSSSPQPAIRNAEGKLERQNHDFCEIKSDTVDKRSDDDTLSQLKASVVVFEKLGPDDVPSKSNLDNNTVVESNKISTNQALSGRMNSTKGHDNKGLSETTAPNRKSKRHMVDECQKVLLNAFSIAMTKKVSSINCLKVLSDDSQSSNPSPSVSEKKSAAKQMSNVSKCIENTNASEHGAFPVKPSSKANKSALEYLDPNIPSLHSVPSKQNLSIQSLANKSKDSVVLTSSIAHKRKTEAPEDTVKPSQIKRRRGVKDYAVFHNKGTKTSLPASIYLRGSQTFPTKITTESVENDGENQQLDLNDDGKESLISKEVSEKEDDFERQDELITDSSCALLKCAEPAFKKEHHEHNSSYLPPISTEHTPPRNKNEKQLCSVVSNSECSTSQNMNEDDLTSMDATPLKTNQNGLENSSKTYQSPSASLVLSPSIYLNGASNHNTPNTIAKSANGIYNPNNDCSRQLFMNEAEKAMTTNSLDASNPVFGHNSKSGSDTPACSNFVLVKKERDNLCSVQHSADKKMTIKRKPSTPVSGKSSLNSNSPREKGKPMQSLLQQFGFRSTSKNKDAASPKHMNLIKPKLEPMSPRLSNTDANNDVIIISDNEDDSQQIKSRKLAEKSNSEQSIVIISSSEKASGSSEKASGSSENASGSRERTAPKQKQEKKKNSETVTHVRNVFESMYNSSSDKISQHEELSSKIDEDSQYIGKDDCGRIPLSTKRQLFTAKPSSSSSSLPLKSISSKNNSNKNKKPVIILKRCDRVSESGKGIEVVHDNSNSEPLDKCGVEIDQLPHVSWPSFFSSNTEIEEDAADKQFVPSIVSECMESSRENGFYSTALNHGKPTLARMPNVNLLKQLIHLLSCDDTTVINQTFSDLMSWVQNYPPTTSSMVKIYSDLFGLSSNQSFLCSLLQDLTDTQQPMGLGHVLEFTVTVFEMNFSSCLESKNKKTIKECLLVKWLWSHAQAVHHNSKTKQLLKAFEAVLSRPQSTSEAIEFMLTLISMAAECFRLVSVNWNTQNRSFRSDTITLFALDTAKIIRDASADKEAFFTSSHLMSIRLAWFRTMITASVLSFLNDYLLTQRIQVCDISLKSIVMQYFFLLPPLSSHENSVPRPTVFSQHRDDEFLTPRKKNKSNNKISPSPSKIMTPSKVNKQNGKGESALHTAAIKGDVVRMKNLLSVPGIDVNLKDNSGWTPLHEACNHGRYACVELLLKYVPPKTLDSFFHKKEDVSGKVDINALAFEDVSPLHDAVIANQVEICKLLLKFGGKRMLEMKTVKGYTALDLASNKEMYQVLSSWNDNSCDTFNFLNLSQDSQSEDSFSFSQSESLSTDGQSLPSDYMYDQVLNTAAGSLLSASYSNCSVFVSLITLLLTSYLASTSVTNEGEDGLTVKTVRLLKEQELSVVKRMRFYVKLFKKHLKKISTPDTYECLQAQLLMFTAAVNSSAGF